MKKILTSLIIAAMLCAMIIPMTAGAIDGDQLIKVDFLNDKFETVDPYYGSEVKFEEKWDMSKVTSDTLFITKKQDATDEAWKACLWYVEKTGYYVTESTKYTAYFEVASPHSTKYSGVPFLLTEDPEDHFYDNYYMYWGHFSDAGDNKDSEGNRWTEMRMTMNYGILDCIVGDGYNSNKLSYIHPAFVTETVSETCLATEVTELKFVTMKIEYEGLNVYLFYLDEKGDWIRIENDGAPMCYEADYGSEIVLGTYSRDQERHNIIRNIKLLQGTGLTLAQIQNANQTKDPKPAKPAPLTTEPEVTEAPEETEPETDAPAATDPAPTEGKVITADPGTEEPAKKGCGSFIGIASVMALAAAGVMIRKKH